MKKTRVLQDWVFSRIRIEEVLVELIPELTRLRKQSSRPVTHPSCILPGDAKIIGKITGVCFDSVDASEADNMFEACPGGKQLSVALLRERVRNRTTGTTS
jgi:hypothetical protein